MENTVITEAFRSLDMLSTLNEEDFSLRGDGLESIKDFIDNDKNEPSIEVIDPNAESEEDLKDSYVGKVICECVICRSKLYKDKEDLQIDEEEQVVNLGEECPFCYSTKGFEVIGQVAPFTITDLKNADGAVPAADAADVPADVPADDMLGEGLEEEFPNPEKHEKVDSHKGVDIYHCNDCGKYAALVDGKKVKKDSVDELKAAIDSVNESVNISATGEDSVNMTKSDDGSISINVGPNNDNTISPVGAGEQIVPVTPDLEADIEANKPEGEEDEVDQDIRDFDEEAFDELGESYLTKIYDNVKSFKTNQVRKRPDDSVIIEGIITFNSGANKVTTFKFTPDTITEDGKVKLLGENLQISRGKKSFTLNGRVDGLKLISESLSYNYMTKDSKGKSTKLYGTVRREGGK